MTYGIEKFMDQMGEFLLTAALAVIGWIMATFTKRHLQSMDRLTERLGFISADVATMKNDIGAIRVSQERLDARVTKLEDHNLNEAISQRERP